MQNLLFTTSLTLLALSAGVVVSSAAEQKPNIVLIYADDLGYGDVGCYGATKAQTPHIDRLAREGRLFTDAHSASAVCSPARYGLLTGRYPLRRNFWGPTWTFSELTIDTKRPTLASIARSAGYATAIIGKWHLGLGQGSTDWNAPLRPGPLELGFDYYFGMPTVNSGAPCIFVENDRPVGYDPKDPFVRGVKSLTQVWPEKGSYNEIGGAKAAFLAYREEEVGQVFVDKAKEWLGPQMADKTRPFFMYFATTHIHHPFTPHPRFKGTSQCGLYGDFIHELDWMVGELLKALDEGGVADNTIVIFSSDNGGMLNATGQEAWKAGHRMNGKLQGFKFGAWEGGHRVPFLVRWPGIVPAGTVSDALVSQTDLMATFAEIVGKPLPKDAEVDSINQLLEFAGTADGPLRTEMIISPNSPMHLTVRKGDWVYIPARDEGGFQGKKIGDHLFGGAATQPLTKMINSDVENGKIQADAPPAQLYNLETDPHQRVNVYNQHPEVVQEMAAILAMWQSKIPAGPRLGWINLKQH